MGKKNNKKSATNKPQCRGRTFNSPLMWFAGIFIIIITGAIFFFSSSSRVHFFQKDEGHNVVGDINRQPLHVGVLKVGDDIGLATKKNKQCTVLPTICVDETTYDIVLRKDNHRFAPPAEGTAYANVLDRIKQLQSILGQHDAIYVPKNKFEEQLILHPLLSMSRRHGAGTYFIEEDLKHGRTTDLKNAQTERYSSKTGMVTSFWDGYPTEVLTTMNKHLDDVYNDIVKTNFHEGFPAWLKKATIDDAGTMEKQLGGLSIYFVIAMHMATQSSDDDPQFGGGGKKYGQMKALHLNMIESSNQLNHIGEQEGVVHEHLHSTFHDYVIRMDKIVEEDVKGPFADALRKATGHHVTQLSFEHQRDSASWAPGFTVFSTSFLNRKFHESARKILSKSFEIGEWGNLQQEKRDDVLDHFVDIVCCGELLESIDAAAPVDEIISKALEQCKPSDLDSMVELTPLQYDILHGVDNSYTNGDWFDPITAEPKCEGNGDGAYDTNQFKPEDRKKARDTHEEEIVKLKTKADECKDDTIVHFTRMNTCHECYKDTPSRKLEDVIKEKGFVMLHEFVNVKSFFYRSPVTSGSGNDCCVAMIQLHGPLHLALDSRPPWDDFKFGEKNYQQHSDTAVSFHWLHATSLTFRGVNKHGFETPKQMVGTILPAFALRMFELTRLHLGDSRVATWFGKTLLLGKNSGSSLEYKKCLNRFCRRKHGDTATWFSNSIYIRIMNRISQAGPGSEMTDVDIAESVYKMLMKEKREEERKIYEILDDLERKYFEDESSLMAAIFKVHDKTWNPIIQGKKDAEESNAAKREELREEARQKTKATEEEAEAFLDGFDFP